MYDEKRVWVPAEPVIPNDKYDFIIRRGIKAFARECCPCWNCRKPLDEYVDYCIKWLKVPDDWSKEQVIKAIAPVLPEIHAEENEKLDRADEMSRELNKKWKVVDRETGETIGEDRDD